MLEVWKDIDAFKGYQISNLGVARSIDRIIPKKDKTIQKTKGRCLKHFKSSKGYLYVTLYSSGKKKNLSLHSLVAIAFIPNRYNKPCVNHIDGNKLNNSIDNLEWMTYSENNQHAYDTGLKFPRR